MKNYFLLFYLFLIIIIGNKEKDTKQKTYIEISNTQQKESITVISIYQPWTKIEYKDLKWIV
jgi:hypothetical protein